MFPKPLLAASFEPLVLALLGRGETYGYEIIQQIQKLSEGRITWTANRLYPLLHDLENRRLVASSWRHDEPGPGRKYYRLTPRGEEALAHAKRDWLDLNALLAALWGPTPSLAT
jgi:PadR family transcriptional regulator, regulatory protein PadR